MRSNMQRQLFEIIQKLLNFAANTVGLNCVDGIFKLMFFSAAEVPISRAPETATVSGRVKSKNETTPEQKPPPTSGENLMGTVVPAIAIGAVLALSAAGSIYIFRNRLCRKAEGKEHLVSETFCIRKAPLNEMSFFAEKGFGRNGTADADGQLERPKDKSEQIRAFVEQRCQHGNYAHILNRVVLTFTQIIFSKVWHIMSSVLF